MSMRKQNRVGTIARLGGRMARGIVALSLAAVVAASAADPAAMSKAAGPRLGEISVVEVTIADRAELGRLAQAEYNISRVRGNVVTIYATADEVDALRREGYAPRLKETQPRPPGPAVPWGKGVGVYHTFATMTSDLNALAAAHPDICRMSSIGRSTQGRDLWALRITDNPDADEGEPRVLFAGSIHGDEYVGGELCLYWANYLLGNYATNTRVAQDVNGTDIWIIPVANPDGWEAGTRFNAKGFDLNRSFPEGSTVNLGNPVYGPAMDTNGRPPEVISLMQLATNHSFALSVMYHCGALVVNYPYDNNALGNVDSPSPDDALFEAISHEYALHNTPMYQSTEFPGGIVNGAAWYTITGGMQDWNYRYAGCNNVTIEVSGYGRPAESELAQFWSDNRESMLSFLETAHTGIGGTITAEATSNLLYATVSVEGIDHLVVSDRHAGDYCRMLLPGTYNVVVSAPGYQSKRITQVAVTQGQTTHLDVSLSLSALWAGATDMGNGWRWLGWFGFFADSGGGWIYHLSHGWMYAAGTAPSSIWLWTPDLGWLWSGNATYPFMYRQQPPAWLWYQRESRAPRWFYNFGAQAWESH